MHSNVALLEAAASRLRHLVPEVLFVGGATLDLLITDEAAAPIRVTDDVDVVLKITTYVDYLAFSERLRALGFSEDSSPGGPICRFLHGNLRLDAMPLSDKVLGFSNRWYPDAVRHGRSIALPSGKVIRMISAPFFLGTKMVAFHGRGKRDFHASHDLEDFIAVVDGRSELAYELETAPADLREYLRETTSALLKEGSFRDALPGFVPGDAVSRQRVPLILKKLEAMSAL